MPRDTILKAGIFRQARFPIHRFSSPRPNPSTFFERPAAVPDQCVMLLTCEYISSAALITFEFDS